MGPRGQGGRARLAGDEVQGGAVLSPHPQALHGHLHGAGDLHGATLHGEDLYGEGRVQEEECWEGMSTCVCICI